MTVMVVQLQTFDFRVYTFPHTNFYDIGLNVGFLGTRNHFEIVLDDKNGFLHVLGTLNLDGCQNYSTLRVYFCQSHEPMCG